MANRKITPKEFRQRVAEWAASDDGLAYEAKLEDEAANRALRRDLEADVLTLANRIYYRKYISDEELYRAALDRHERWRKENPEAYAASRAKYYATEKGRLYKWSNSASQRCRKIEVFRKDGRTTKRPGGTITAQDLRDLWVEQDGKCALTGRPMVMLNGVHSLDSPSVDRVEPSGCYEVGNVRLITYQANCAKHFGTDEDLIAFCEDILSHRQSALALRNRLKT